MSITPVPISMRLVRAAIADKSGNGDASWRAKWCTRKKAPSTVSSSAAAASSIDCTRASRAVLVREPGMSCQWPKERKPIFFMWLAFRLVGDIASRDAAFVPFVHVHETVPRSPPIAARIELDVVDVIEDHAGSGFLVVRCPARFGPSRRRELGPVPL